VCGLEIRQPEEPTSAGVVDGSLEHPSRKPRRAVEERPRDRCHRDGTHARHVRGDDESVPVLGDTLQSVALMRHRQHVDRLRRRHVELPQPRRGAVRRPCVVADGQDRGEDGLVVRLRCAGECPHASTTPHERAVVDEGSESIDGDQLQGLRPGDEPELATGELPQRSHGRHLPVDV
jgi:hypothetical protein